MSLSNLVILAAGQGKRMRTGRPKVLHLLAGQPLLSHVLATARALRPQRIVVVYSDAALLEAYSDADDISWVKQFPQRGTGDALLQALPLLGDGQVLVLYGDCPLVSSQTLEQLLAQATLESLTLLTARVADASGYGRIVRNSLGAVSHCVEHADATTEQLAINEINTGILVAPLHRLKCWLTKIKADNAQQEYYLTDIVALAAAEQLPIHALCASDTQQVLGINNQQQLAAAERYYQWQQAQQLLDLGVTLADPARLDIRGCLSVGKDVAIDVNCIFSGQVKLGDRVRIEANCVLHNVSIADDVHIAAYSHLDGAVIGQHCRIGPFARIRPGSVLQHHVHIGNFVEVKNSTIASHSKANHLSYIGDARIAEHVNMGAGSITCNYNGVHKAATEIAEHAFIGSGCMLVAPLKIGAYATIGAGSVITKMAPAGQLTLSRTAQQSYPNWQRPRRPD